MTRRPPSPAERGGLGRQPASPRDRVADIVDQLEMSLVKTGLAEDRAEAALTRLTETIARLERTECCLSEATETIARLRRDLENSQAHLTASESKAAVLQTQNSALRSQLAGIGVTSLAVARRLSRLSVCYPRVSTSTKWLLRMSRRIARAARFR